MLPFFRLLPHPNNISIMPSNQVTLVHTLNLYEGPWSFVTDIGINTLNILESIRIGPRRGLNLPIYHRGATALPTLPFSSICILISYIFDRSFERYQKTTKPPCGIMLCLNYLKLFWIKIIDNSMCIRLNKWCLTSAIVLEVSISLFEFALSTFSIKVNMFDLELDIGCISSFFFW